MIRCRSINNSHITGRSKELKSSQLNMSMTHKSSIDALKQLLFKTNPQFFHKKEKSRSREKKRLKALKVQMEVDSSTLEEEHTEGQFQLQHLHQKIESLTSNHLRYDIENRRNEYLNQTDILKSELINSRIRFRQALSKTDKQAEVLIQTNLLEKTSGLVSQSKCAYQKLQKLQQDFSNIVKSQKSSLQETHCFVQKELEKLEAKSSAFHIQEQNSKDLLQSKVQK